MTSDKRNIELLTKYAEKQGMSLEELGTKIESSIVNDNEMGRRTPEEIEALFKKSNETVIEGWVAKDHAYADVDFYTQEPYWNDESEMWAADGRKCTFSPDLFPDLAVEKPKKIRITITPME